MVSVVDRATFNFVHAAELCFALGLRIVPRRYRFDAALSLTRATLPLFRRTEAYREQEIKKFHRPREIALHLILNALSKNGTPFEPRIEIKGYDRFAQAYARGKGVLVIGHHAALTLLMVRFFYDQGFDPIVITPDDKLRVGGTLVTTRTIQPSATFFVKLRNRLKSGELVCGMPDRALHHEGRTVEFATASGQIIFAPAMIQVAARCGAEVLFTEVRVEDRNLVATIVAPSSSSARNAAAITEDFISFVREQTAMHCACENANDAHLRRRGHTQNASSPAQAALATPEVD